MTDLKNIDLLSRNQKFRRTYYKLLSNYIESFLIEKSLIDSYYNFKNAKIKYPFVEKRELKPRTIKPNIEHKLHKTFLVIFLEDYLESIHKKYIRFLDINKITKANISLVSNIDIKKDFHINKRDIDNISFFDFFDKLLDVDYALLIQRKKQKEDKYSLSHFHVKVDWPVTEAAENLAKRLRYISSDIYERGEKYAENIQKKFFEYYCLPAMTGGRRTAAVVAAEYLKKLPFISTIYTASSEDRTFLKINEEGVSKHVLMKVSQKIVKTIVEKNNIDLNYFEQNYVVEKCSKSLICIFRTKYSKTIHSMPPADGKMRVLKMEPNWLSVTGQYIVPKPDKMSAPPIEHKVIY